MKLQRPDPQEAELRRASQRLLFGKKPEIPGEGQAADRSPKRHVRLKVTINLDSDVIEHFKELAKREGAAYQFLINQALREYVEGTRTERIAKDVGEMLLGDSSFWQRVQESLKKHE